ncbi:DNA polymerase III subunit gamma/tau [Spiroplasma cantharicola]|uniref:DNA polymerase III subunit gamma/tau n=1 Tax=Spiroplasma cantharicola TaxID=362837 RepID=A0A0M4JVS3_9MOLU|nr:DNA polymerase III subunit gamma/tau [Spiroplasma cantharicola]ALD65917.1 DNA polymerase III subunits gamma and tau [Spiroplasma cantharicola]
MENKKSLYREYRPKNFDQVAGHNGIKEILISQINSNSFGHALLFSGQRGTGKTSIAKIFAKIVNCQNLNGYNPCDNCISCKEFNNNAHSDIFEIDAASNNGVEEIRNIKANVSLLPSFSKYKVYIIDEVHMLSNSAFNALLKTLEEPPKHVIFILATTEFSKIPATIISRCQLFNFKKIGQKDLEQKVEEICKAEGKIITKEALNEIYYMSDGSLRDALNYLEQSLTISEKEVNVEILKKIFYIATKVEKLNIIKNVIQGNTKEIISYFEVSNNQGIDFQTMTLSLLDIIKEIIEVKLTQDYNFLSNLTIEDFNNFNQTDIKIMFDLADNISDSYTKSKNSNISFQYILINILKTVSTKKLISVIEKDKLTCSLPTSTINWDEPNTDKTNNLGENLKEKSFELNKNIVSQEKKSQDEKNMNNNFSVKNNIQDFFKEKDDSKFLKLQMKLLISEAIIYKNIIDFTNDQIINVLVGANKQARKYYEEKFERMFNEEVINGNSKFIENFIMFYGSKITASSEDSVILVSDERTISKWINNRLQKPNIRKQIYEYFGKEVKIISLDKTRWSEIKIEFMDRKNNNKLEEFKHIDTEYFYEALNKKDDNDENQYLKRAKEILGDQNIKVVN